MSLNKTARALKHKSTKFTPKLPQLKTSTNDTKAKTIRKTKKRTKSFFKPSAEKLLARKVVSEIIGFAPYELRAMDLLKKDQEKRCKKFLRKRIGRMNSVKKKMEKLEKVVRESKVLD